MMFSFVHRQVCLFVSFFKKTIDSFSVCVSVSLSFPALFWLNFVLYISFYTSTSLKVFLYIPIILLSV